MRADTIPLPHLCLVRPKQQPVVEVAGKGAESQLCYISILYNYTILYYAAIRSEAAATHSSLILDASPRVRENTNPNKEC